MKLNTWKTYTFEFLSIFIAVVSAFALTSWNENRNNAASEQKILSEIKNGIGLDKKDFESNIKGHEMSIKANAVFRDLLNNKPIAQDSIGLYYIALFRDYTPLINSSGYESLKEAGLKTVTNDALRFQIISLYDYHYGIIKVLASVDEMQYFGHYFEPVNNLLHPYMHFNARGGLTKIDYPKDLSDRQRKEILSYLWRTENNRLFKLMRNRSIIEEMKKVTISIDQELNF